MKPLLPQFVFVLALVAISARAQTPTPVDNAANRNGTIILSPRQALDNGIRVKPDATAVQAAEVRERIERFERIRDQYLREQERLRRLLNGAATDDERARVRDLIAKTREQFLDNLKRFREEMKDRLAEVRQRLPEMREVLDNAKDNARDSINQVRKRRGTD